MSGRDIVARIASAREPLRITTARWTTPDGASVEGTGVVPDIALELAPDLTVPELVDAVLSVGA